MIVKMCSTTGWPPPYLISWQGMDICLSWGPPNFWVLRCQSCLLPRHRSLYWRLLFLFGRHWHDFLGFPQTENSSAMFASQSQTCKLECILFNLEVVQIADYLQKITYELLLFHILKWFRLQVSVKDHRNWYLTMQSGLDCMMRWNIWQNVRSMVQCAAF
jgi:hypothetical protein